MILAISNIAWAPQDRMAAYAAMVAKGVSGLEIAPALFFHAAEDPFKPDPSIERKAVAEIAEMGITPVSMQSLLFGEPHAALFGGPEALTRFETRMRGMIALSSRLGIPNLVFGSPHQRRKPEGMKTLEALDHAASVFRVLGDFAQAGGTKIAIEPNPPAYGTNFLNTMKEAATFVAFVDHPAIGLVLDTSALQMTGEFDSVTRESHHLLSDILHVHLSEPGLAPAPADPQQTAQLLSALKDAGYRKAVSIEMRPPPQGVAGIRDSLTRLTTAMRNGNG